MSAMLALSSSRLLLLESQGHCLGVRALQISSASILAPPQPSQFVSRECNIDVYSED